MKSDQEISFIIRFVLTSTNINNETENLLTSNPNSWKDFIKAIIRFTSHEEDSIESLSNSFRTRPSLNKAIEKSEQKNIKIEQKEMLERKINSKIELQNQLNQQINHLENLILEQKTSIQEILNKPDSQNTLLIVGLFVFIVSLLFRFFKKK